MSIEDYVVVPVSPAQPCRVYETAEFISLVIAIAFPKIGPLDGEQELYFVLGEGWIERDHIVLRPRNVAA